MTVRTDANLKAVFTSLCEEFGMNANTAMNVFMRAVVDVLSQVLEENRKLDRPELTLEEINAEIAVEMKALEER